MPAATRILVLLPHSIDPPKGVAVPWTLAELDDGIAIERINVMLVVVHVDNLEESVLVFSADTLAVQPDSGITLIEMHVQVGSFLVVPRILGGEVVGVFPAPFADA